MITTALGLAPGTAPERRTLRATPLIAGIAFSLSWLVGLSVFTSSTDVRASGRRVLNGYTTHQSAVAVQYILTEGLPAVFLAFVTWSLARAISERATASRRLVLAGGLAAAMVSLAELALGLWLDADLVSSRNASAVGTVFRSINQLDGVKMLLIAVIALVAMRAIQRRDVALPKWLTHVALALAGTITLSAIGYLTPDNTFAAAAWVSLPCLLVFVTGTGVALNRRTARHR